MRRIAILASSIAVIAAALIAPGASAANLTPRIIAGQPGGPYAGGVVGVQVGDYLCSGALWKPNIVITAGHCIINEDGSVNPANSISFYPPGGDTNGNTLPARVTTMFYNSQYQNQASGESDQMAGLDAAFLVLDQPIGTPVVNRLATQTEAQAISMTGTPLTLNGYGQQTSAQNSAQPAFPLTATFTPTTPTYDGGFGFIELAIPGPAAPCFGDSGGPYVASVVGLTLLVGTDAAGDGPPCDPDGAAPSEELTVTAGFINAIPNSLARANQEVEAVPTTCVNYSNSSNSCNLGNAWIYTGCWSGQNAVMQQQVGGRWQTIGKLTAQQGAGCSGANGWSLTMAGFIASGSQQMRVVQGTQPPDTFTVSVA